MNEEGGKYVVDYGKLMLLALVIIGGFALVLCAIIAFDPSDERFGPVLALGSAQIAGAMGYLTGTGRLAARGVANVPAIGATPHRVASAALEVGELANVPTGELLARKAELRQKDQTAAVYQGLAAIAAELERRTA
ncbi:MAG: hypothetical protein AB7H92_18625 [Microbacteriaceae bacterium]